MYSISIKPSALKELGKLPRGTIKKIGQSIDALAENPRPDGIKKIKRFCGTIVQDTSG
jgi:mRNA-degrading endonuclease RelE of RelBE toxin-antitoxin system